MATTLVEIKISSLFHFLAHSENFADLSSLSYVGIYFKSPK